MEHTKRIILIDLKGKRYYLDVPLNSDKNVVIFGNERVFVRGSLYFNEVEAYTTNIIHVEEPYED